MKNARIKRLAFGISLALTGAQIAMGTATAVELPEFPPFDLVSGLNNGTFSAQESSVTPIEYGSPASGVIGDANDFVGSDGTYRSDLFVFTITDSSKPYVVTLRSDSFIAQSHLLSIDEAAGQLVPEQSANVWAPGRQVQYSGTLPQPGRYVIEVGSLDGNSGGYTVSLDEGASDTGVPVGSTGCEVPGDENSFIEVVTGATLNCNLEANEPITLNSEAGQHHAKGFHFTGNGASVTIRAGSGAFTPLIVLVDPSSGQVLDYGQGELSGSFTGDVFYLVSSTEAGATGPFTSGIETGGTGGGSGGFLRGAEAAAPMDMPSYLVIGE